MNQPRERGADMIVLRPCYECGVWPYAHAPDCPVGLAREREHRGFAAQMVALYWSAAGKASGV